MQFRAVIRRSGVDRFLICTGNLPTTIECVIENRWKPNFGPAPFRLARYTPTGFQLNAVESSCASFLFNYPNKVLQQAQYWASIAVVSNSWDDKLGLGLDASTGYMPRFS